MGWLSTMQAHMALTRPQVKHHLNKQVYIDATEAFKQLAPQKKWRTALFGCYCTGFMITTYRRVVTFAVVIARLMSRLQT